MPPEARDVLRVNLVLIGPDPLAKNEEARDFWDVIGPDISLALKRERTSGTQCQNALLLRGNFLRRKILIGWRKSTNLLSTIPNSIRQGTLFLFGDEADTSNANYWLDIPLVVRFRQYRQSRALLRILYWLEEFKEMENGGADGCKPLIIGVKVMAKRSVIRDWLVGSSI